MDGQRFDDLAKALAFGTSRRSLLRAVLGGSAVISGRQSAQTVAAQKSCADDGDCPSLACCGGVCVNTLFDANHCGGCLSPCPDLPGSICCDGICRNANTDRNHCGDCDRSCDDDLCVDGQCCAAAAYCAGSCCAAGEACLAPLRSGDRGICCPPRQVGNGLCCGSGEEFITNTKGEPECCSAQRICDVGKDTPSFLCCFTNEVCVPHSACCPKELVCNGKCCNIEEFCQDGDCVFGRLATPGAEFCVPRRGKMAAAKSAAVPSNQDDPLICITAADCCESGDLCIEGSCQPRDEEVTAREPAADYLDLSPFPPLPTELDPNLGHAGGTMILSSDGLAAIGISPDLASNLAPGFAGGYTLRYSSPPNVDGTADTIVTMLALGYLQPDAAAAGVEVLYFSQPPGFADITQGTEGDKGYTVTFPFAPPADPNRSGTAFESGAYLADIARVVMIRTEFFEAPDLSSHLSLLDAFLAAFRVSDPRGGHSPGVALVPDSQPSVAWQHLQVDGELTALAGESDDQIAARLTEFSGFSSALAVRGAVGTDGRFTFGNRILVTNDSATGANYVKSYPDQFADLVASQGIVGERFDLPISFGDITAFYRFSRDSEDGVEPGTTMAGFFDSVATIDGSPASLVVTVSIRDLETVAADDPVGLEAGQENIATLLESIAPSYDRLIRAFPYDNTPRVYTLPIPVLPLPASDP